MMVAEGFAKSVHVVVATAAAAVVEVVV
jgi:hypothetical protein